MLRTPIIFGNNYTTSVRNNYIFALIVKSVIIQRERKNQSNTYGAKYTIVVCVAIVVDRYIHTGFLSFRTIFVSARSFRTIIILLLCCCCTMSGRYFLLLLSFIFTEQTTRPIPYTVYIIIIFSW